MLWNLIIASLDVTKSSHKMIQISVNKVEKAQHCTATTAWTRE